jgi:hypothetical protein
VAVWTDLHCPRWSSGCNTAQEGSPVGTLSQMILWCNTVQMIFQ